jgi:ATP-dependent DNA helicase RecQ
LRGEIELQLRHQARAIKKTKQKKVKTVAELRACDQPLFEALRTRRLQLAREQGVPPYAIFHDSTLREMATQRPMSEDTLSTISGVGEQKLTRFGRIFIDVIRDHPSSALSKTD